MQSEHRTQMVGDDKGFDFYSPPCWPQIIPSRTDVQVTAVTNTAITEKQKHDSFHRAFL